MRMTLDIPGPLMEEARWLLGRPSKTDTAVFALQALIRRKRVDALKTLMGSVRLEVDIGGSRRRPRRRSQLSTRE